MCFKCQETCPAGVPIAEMIYELRNKSSQTVDTAKAAPENPVMEGVDKWHFLSKVKENDFFNRRH